MTAQNILIEQRKIQLIGMIAQLYDVEVVDAIEELLLNSQKDWWENISEQERAAIDVGLADVKNGQLLSNEQVTQEINERYKNL